MYFIIIIIIIIINIVIIIKSNCCAFVMLYKRVNTRTVFLLRMSQGFLSPLSRVSPLSLAHIAIFFTLVPAI